MKYLLVTNWLKLLFSFYHPTLLVIYCGGAVCLDTALKAGRSLVRYPMVSLKFFICIILTASNKNKKKRVPAISPEGGKSGRCVGLTTLPTSCADCQEIWKPQFVEPSGLSSYCFAFNVYLLFKSITYNRTYKRNK